MPPQRPIAPPRARRLARTPRTALPTSLLPVGHDVALADVGFAPVGEVCGAVALSRRAGFANAAGASSSRSRTYTSADHSPWNGPGTGAAVIASGARTAQARLFEEASALDADGVVGVRLDLVRDEELGVWEFTCTGTAVRSTGRRHARTPFTTDLDGVQVASALRGGWMPVAFLVVPVEAVRSLDHDTFRQARRNAPNGELEAYTDVVAACRRDARLSFGVAAKATGADGAVLSGMDLDVVLDFVSFARVVVRGTALVAFRAPDPPSGLTILPLSPTLSPTTSPITSPIAPREHP